MLVLLLICGLVVKLTLALLGAPKRHTARVVRERPQQPLQTPAWAAAMLAKQTQANGAEPDAPWRRTSPPVSVLGQRDGPERCHLDKRSQVLLRGVVIWERFWQLSSMVTQRHVGLDGF